MVKMQNICNFIGRNRVHIYIFNCYSAITGMWNARKQGGIYKTLIYTNLKHTYVGIE